MQAAGFSQYRGHKEHRGQEGSTPSPSVEWKRVRKPLIGKGLRLLYCGEKSAELDEKKEDRGIMQKLEVRGWGLDRKSKDGTALVGRGWGERRGRMVATCGVVPKRQR